MTRMSAREAICDAGPQCPHCGHVTTPDEGHFYDEHRYTDEICGACEKPFKVSVMLSATWTSTIPEPDEAPGVEEAPE
jgi:hypothetical protein